jgi:hypothetical protein
MEDINIPNFITLVADQIREAVRRFRGSGNVALLYLNGLQLHIAFTAEESDEGDGSIELKPWIISLKMGEKQVEKNQIVHAVTLNLSATLVDELPPPFRGTELIEENMSLLLEIARELRTSYQGVVFVGPDTELIPPFPLFWRATNFRIEVRRRLAKQLLQNIDKLNGLADVSMLYEGALGDITFVPVRDAGYAAPPALPGVGFR